jgi:hypothetical protein
MTIEIAGHSIKGTHGVAVAQPRELKVHTAYMWATRGTVQIIGGPASRMLIVDMWVHNKYRSEAALGSALDSFERILGAHGRLTVGGDNRQVFHSCTFEQLEKVPFQGRQDNGPIEDLAGTVDGGWVQSVRLHFRQLL